MVIPTAFQLAGPEGIEPLPRCFRRTCSARPVTFGVDFTYTSGVGPSGKWVFRPGSSGPFGEDTRAVVDRIGVTAKWDHRPLDDWFDFHATRKARNR